jgi:hypothetical protein
MITEQKITAYRGGGEMKDNRRLWYFTPSVQYASWFKKHASLGVGKLFKTEIDIGNFLDLRHVTKSLNYFNLHYILQNNGINVPKWVSDNINSGHGKSKFYMWEFLKMDNELWDNISEKYDGVIILETNPEARHTGKVEALIIDMDRHPVGYTEV